MADDTIDVAPPPAPFEGFRRARSRRLQGLDAREWEPFFFMQLADTQLGFEKTWDDTDNPSIDGWTNEVDLMRRAVGEINRLRPAFAIICGDLVDALPGSAQRGGQISSFKTVALEVDPSIPLVCVCGNHDVGNRPNAASIEAYSRDFGDDYFSFWVSGVKCIVVNSQLWKDASDAEEASAEQDQWLARELADSEDAKHVLVFSHIPPFLFEQDEPTGYFNIGTELRTELLEQFAHHGVRAVFCGHYHRNAGGRYTGPTGHELEVVVTGAVGGQIVDNPDGDPLDLSGLGGMEIGEEVSGLRVVQVGGETIDHRWFSFKDLSDLTPEAAAAGAL